MQLHQGRMIGPTRRGRARFIWDLGLLSRNEFRKPKNVYSRRTATELRFCCASLYRLIGSSSCEITQVRARIAIRRIFAAQRSI